MKVKVISLVLYTLLFTVLGTLSEVFLIGTPFQMSQIYSWALTGLLFGIVIDPAIKFVFKLLGIKGK